MNKIKTILQIAFDWGMKRAKKQTSQIKEIKDIVERIEKEQRIREIEMEIYQLLQKAKSPTQQKKILETYVNGLNEVGEKDRLKYEIVWSKDRKGVEGNRIDKAMIDRNNNQVIVTTSSEKPRNVYCFDFKTGKRNWVYKVRYEQAWAPFLGKNAFFFIPMKNPDSHTWSGDCVHAISLETGELLWKAKPDGDHETAEKIVGLFNDLLLVESFEGLSALNINDGKEEWRCKCSVKSGIKINETFLLVIGERKIGWFSKDGKLLQEKQFKGFKGEGFINFIEQGEDNLYVSVWYTGSRYDKKVDDFVKEKERSFIYYLDKAGRKIKWSLEVIGAHFNKVISQDKKLYILGEDKCLVVDKVRGKIIDELDYNGETVNNGLLLCAGPEDKDDDYSFDFFAIDLSNKKVKWQRKNFSFLALRQGLLYGKVENDLVVLNQNNGKERAKIEINHDIRDIQFIDDKHLLAHGSSFICLIEQK